MGTVIVIVCLVAALDLALFVTLYRRLDALPARVLALAKAERAEGEARALNSLGEAASAKVATITLSLRRYEEQLADRAREALAAAEIRARLSERRSMDAATALGSASQLVRELRRMLLDLSPRPAPSPPADAAPDPGDSGAWLRRECSERPTDPDGDRTRIGVLPPPTLLRPLLAPPHPSAAAPSGDDGAARSGFST
jgi:hypothetical protein